MLVLQEAVKKMREKKKRHEDETKEAQCESPSCMALSPHSRLNIQSHALHLHYPSIFPQHHNSYLHHHKLSLKELSILMNTKILEAHNIHLEEIGSYLKIKFSALQVLFSIVF